jgi:hypothetical protein
MGKTDGKNKKSKYEDEDESEEEQIKKSKKKSHKDEGHRSKSHKNKDDGDILSDIDIKDDGEEIEEDHQNDEIINSKLSKKRIDPKIPIGQLKPEEIFSYLTQTGVKPDEILRYIAKLGEETLNPQLKFGSLHLIDRLVCRRYGSKSRRRPPPRNYSNYGRNYHNKGMLNDRQYLYD